MYNFKLINLVFILNLKYSLVWSENKIIMHSQKKKTEINYSLLHATLNKTTQNESMKKKMSIQGIYLPIIVNQLSY